MKKLEWELEEELEEGVELWLVGERESDVWLNPFDVVIDRNKKVSEVKFEVFGFPRHIVEDSGWKNLRDAIVDLKEAIREMERIDKTAKRLGLKITSDEFIGFRASCLVKSIDKKEIEKRILELKKAFGV